MTSDPNRGENRFARSSNKETGSEDATERDVNAIDPERIAALLDGRLSEAERAELLARLDASPEAFEAYADAVATTRELERDGVIPAAAFTASRASRGSPRPWLSGNGRWMALAATVLVAIAVGLLWPGRRGAMLANPRLVVAALAPSAATMDSIWRRVPWSEVRGDADLLSPRARAVRIGARIADFELLARLGDTAAAPAAMQIAALLDDVPAGAPAAANYRSLAADSATRTTQALTAAASFAEQVAGARDVRLGAWLEAARIAATEQDADFLSSVDSRQALRALDRVVDGEAAATLADLRRAIESSPAPDWATVQVSLARLLGRLATA